MLYKPFSKFIFRSHILPFSRACIDPNIQILDHLNGFFLEAIYLSSIDLYNSIEPSLSDKKLSPKTHKALLRYLLRAKTRCTPFGLLAGVGLGEIGNFEQSAITLASEKNYVRHTRLDMDYLGNLVSILNKNGPLRNSLLYYPNSTLYNMEEAFRYVETSFEGTKRKHHVNSVLKDKYIDMLLTASSEGLTIEDLVLIIDEDEISKEEKVEFVNELIDSQVLISELQINVTGNEAHILILETLARVVAKCDHHPTANHYLGLLSDIFDLLKVVDQKGISSSNIKVYKEIIKRIENLEVPYNPKHLFQSDLVFKTKESKLSNKDVADCYKLIEICTKLTPLSRKTNLSNFAESFNEKWEGKSIPLALALDPEYGIGYPASTNESFTINPLVDDIVLPAANSGATSSELDISLQYFWKKKYSKAIHNGDTEILLQDSDIKEFESKVDKLPNTFYALMNIVETHDIDSKIVLRAVSGSTGANLIGRFAHSDIELEKFCKEICDKEIELCADKILAEIVHLPDARVGNVLARPKLYDYEIEYLAKSVVGETGRILLSDLSLTVVGNKVVLFSKKHNKQVLPRLTTAHNHDLPDCLPVYKFLCDLQYQENVLNGTWINLESIVGEGFNFIPRITYKKNLIISLAKWIFQKKDIPSFSTEDKDTLFFNFSAFKQQWKLPQYIALIERGDNHIIFNTTDIDSVEQFVNSISSLDRIEIVEVLFNDNNNLIKNEAGQNYLNEVVICFHKTTPPLIGDESINKAIADSTQDSFAGKENYYPGSSWLYCKFYLGHFTADKILVELKDLVEELFKDRKIHKWFFIRYSDPNFHLRIRFKLYDNNDFQYVLKRILTHFDSHIKREIIWNIQLDTYKPEYARYGNIEIAETVFCYSSMSVVNYLNVFSSEHDLYKNIFAIKTIDNYLNLFQFDITAKIEFSKRCMNNFAKEFNSDLAVKKQINKKYNEIKGDIERILFFEAVSREEMEICKIIESQNIELSEKIRSLVSVLKREDLFGLIGSYIHMSVNRIFIAKQRLHEYVLYEMVHRSYLSHKIRN